MTKKGDLIAKSGHRSFSCGSGSLSTLMRTVRKNKKKKTVFVDISERFFRTSISGRKKYKYTK